MTWEKFDKEFNKDLINAAKDVANNSSEFSELPLGNYEVKLSSIELKESKAGNPMVATCFEVVAGDYKKRLIFKNTVIYMGDDKDKYRLGNELKFIKSLGSKITISFDGFANFEKLLASVENDIKESKLEHLLSIGESKGYRTYKIEEIYEPEAIEITDDTPF